MSIAKIIMLVLMAAMISVVDGGFVGWFVSAAVGGKKWIPFGVFAGIYGVASIFLLQAIWPAYSLPRLSVRLFATRVAAALWSRI